MSEHTPGPWDFEQVGNGLETEHYCIFAPNHLPALNIARTPFMEGDDLANAHLIAAAPELLETLKYIMGALEEIKPIDGSEVVLIAAKALIAKAEGK